MGSGTLHDVFLSFCGFGANRQKPVHELDSSRFMKLCNDCGLLCKRFTRTDADLLFTRVKAPGERRIGWAVFRDVVVGEVAAIMGVARAELAVHLQQCSGPQFRSASARISTDLSASTLPPSPASPPPPPQPRATGGRSSGRKGRAGGAPAMGDGAAALKQFLLERSQERTGTEASRSQRDSIGFQQQPPRHADPFSRSSDTAPQATPRPGTDGAPGDLNSVLRDMLETVGSLAGGADTSRPTASPPALFIPRQTSSHVQHGPAITSPRLPSPVLHRLPPASPHASFRHRSPSPSVRSVGPMSASGMEIGSIEEPLHATRLPGRIGRVLPWESPNWRSAPSVPPGCQGSPPKWRPGGRAPPPGLRWSGSGGLVPVGGRESPTPSGTAFFRSSSVRSNNSHSKSLLASSYSYRPPSECRSRSAVSRSVSMAHSVNATSAVGSIEEPLRGTRLPGRIGRVLPWESPNWRSAPSVPPGLKGSPTNKWRPGGQAPPPGMRWSGSGGLTPSGGRANA
eukprot:Hpha_TRINITY_DN15381_c0_g4::TRINITY_DN15381_c0_g4_i1::g.90846::m.90846